MSSLAAARADNFYYPKNWTPEQVKNKKQLEYNSKRDHLINTIDHIPLAIGLAN